MEVHPGGGMKSGQHEPLGGGGAVDRYSFKQSLNLRVFHSHIFSEVRWRVLTALSLMLSVTILQLKATSHPRFPLGTLFK